MTEAGEWSVDRLCNQALFAQFETEMEMLISLAVVQFTCI